MRYLYGAADEKYVWNTLPQSQATNSKLDTYEFRPHSFLRGKPYYDKNDVPIDFKVTPDTLLFLAARVVDALPLPSVYEWTNIEVCRWIRNYGYKHYQNTFRENLIHGRTLLLLDASALSAMNIKNFADIQHIAYGIRCLFHFEMAKFARSISLAPQLHYELYKLFRVKSGPKYENTLRSQLWRQMQLLREIKPNLCHWELLENWLARLPDPRFHELFGGVRRARLYRCKPPQSGPPPPPPPIVICDCMPPCECYWTEARDLRKPWRLSVLGPGPVVQKSSSTLEAELAKRKQCNCMPPCTCHWKPRVFMHSKVLNCLLAALPHKYGPLRYTRHASQTTMSGVRLSQRKSYITP